MGLEVRLIGTANVCRRPGDPVRVPNVHQSICSFRLAVDGVAHDIVKRVLHLVWVVNVGDNAPQAGKVGVQVGGIEDVDGRDGRHGAVVCRAMISGHEG